MNLRAPSVKGGPKNPGPQDARPSGSCWPGAADPHGMAGGWDLEPRTPRGEAEKAHPPQAQDPLGRVLLVPAACQ